MFVDRNENLFSGGTNIQRNKYSSTVVHFISISTGSSNW